MYRNDVICIGTKSNLKRDDKNDKAVKPNARNQK